MTSCARYKPKLSRRYSDNDHEYKDAMHRPFFIESISFREGLLTLDLSDGTTPAGTIQFHSPRAFRFFSESDSYDYLSAYEGEVLFESEGSGLYRSRTSGYLQEYLRDTPEHRRDEVSISVLVQTPQECVEVITFEDPSIAIDQRA